MNVELLRGKLAAAVLWAVLLFALSGLPGPAFNEARSASSVRLIMVEEPGCRFCRQWDAEIAPGYRKSAEGRFAPLKRVRRGAREAQPDALRPQRLVRDGVERGTEQARAELERQARAVPPG